MRAHKPGRPLGLFLALVAVGACELSLTDLPLTESVIVVHGVLNRAATTQAILLERSLSGDLYVVEGRNDNSIPVVSEGGIALPRAIVRLVTPVGDTLLAREDGVPNRNLGVYRFTLPGNALVPDGVYRLLIRTEGGEIAAARVRVPGGPIAAATAPRGFNRTHDTVLVEWSPVPGARAYAIRVEGPYGAFRMLTEGTQLRLTGSLRNIDADGMPRVFLPGFQQMVTVAAVDSNYYDYYRSGNDPSTGRGLVNRIEGGLGLFGAMGPVFRQRFDVTGSSGDPIEGVWVPTEAQPYFAASLRLYLESYESRSGDGDAITGRYTHTLGFTGALLATRRGDSIWVRLLENEVASDTAEFFRAAIRGDSMHATYSKGATYTFVKQ